MRTLHVGLRVADLERSLTFYSALGYEVVGHVPRTELGSLTMLKLPGDEFVSLELVPDPDRERRDPGGITHLVVQVEAIRETIALLTAAGVEAQPPSSPDDPDGADGLWTSWVTDPDGHRIELVQWPAGHPNGMTSADLSGPDAPPRARSARDVIEELFRGLQVGDESVLDDLVVADMVNHAAGPQGREGLKQVLSTIDVDLGPVTVVQHHLFGEGDLVAQHLTLHGTHRASTMPLLADATVSGHQTAWTFIHLWRVAEGLIVEHWACRDDMGLLEQLQD